MNLFFLEPIFLATKYFFSETDISLDSSPELRGKSNSPYLPPDTEKNLKFIFSGSTLQTSINSEKLTFASENPINTSVTVQRRPLSTIRLAPAITPTIIFDLPISPIHLM